MTSEVRERISNIQGGKVPNGYKKTPGGIIPVDWECKKISECLNICNNERKPISEEVRKTIPGPYAYYGPTQAQGYISTYESEGPAVLIGEDGDHFLKYKEKDMTFLIDGQYTVNNHAHLIRGTEICTAQWFCYAYQHKSLQQAITRQGAGRYKLTKDALSKLYVCFPNASRDKEHQRILDIIETQDKVIELKEKLIKEKRKEKKYLMQQLLIGKKRLPGFSDTWKMVRASTIFQNVSNKNHDGSLEVLSATQNRGVIPRSQVDIDIKYDKSSLDSYKKVDIGNFIISLRSFQGGIEYSEHEGIVSPAYTVLAPRIPIVDGFYKQFFKSQDYINRLNVAVYGIRDGKQISYSDFGRILVPYPSIDEQKAIAELFSTLDREIDLLQRNIEQEKLKKKALMQLLLTGIVRV